MLDEARFDAVLQRLTGQPARAGAFDRLVAAYREPTRHYHGEAHIAHCLAELDGAAGQAAHADAVELAIWLHDVVYDPQGAENEALSADWAAALLEAVGCEVETIARVRELILATRHLEPPPSPDAALLMDIDLAVLGVDAEAYAAYEAAIHREYAWVPEPFFRGARAGILQGFLDRPRIFYTDHFHARYEAAARDNLRRAVASLTVEP